MKKKNVRFSERDKQDVRDRRKYRRIQKDVVKKHGTVLYGKNTIIERLRANPESIQTIYLQDRVQSKFIERMAQEHSISIKYVSEREMSKIKQADRVQGVAAEVTPFEYADYADLIAKAEKKKCTLLFLDEITDPHNLGAIIRSCACFGKIAIVIPRNSSCGVNDTVMHVASGGENYVRIAMVNNLRSAVQEAKEAFITILGAIVEDAEDLGKTELKFPLGLVLGSEGGGIRKGIRDLCDAHVKIPMDGASLSFNVSNAAALFCYEIVRQRD